MALFLFTFSLFFKINLIADTKLIIPEYKIELLNKSKKVINTFEKIEKIYEVNLISQSKEKVNKNKVSSKAEQKKLKKTKTLKKKISPLRTLWVRRKKKN